MPSWGRRYVVYRLLAAATALFCFLLGALFVVAFLDRALFQVFARPLFDTNYWGYYILAFTGSTLVAWGGCLLGAARDPARAPVVGTATAAALILASIVRLLAWYAGDYRAAADQLRLEAAALALIALAFVWSKPPRGDGT